MVYLNRCADDSYCQQFAAIILGVGMLWQIFRIISHTCSHSRAPWKENSFFSAYQRGDSIHMQNISPISANWAFLKQAARLQQTCCSPCIDSLNPSSHIFFFSFLSDWSYQKRKSSSSVQMMVRIFICQTFHPMKCSHLEMK